MQIYILYIYIYANHSVYMKVSSHTINHQKAMIFPNKNNDHEPMWSNYEIITAFLLGTVPSWKHLCPLSTSLQEDIWHLRAPPFLGLSLSGAPCSQATAITRLWSAVSAQPVGAMEPSPDPRKNLMPFGLLCWSEWIHSVSGRFGGVHRPEWAIKVHQGQLSISSQGVDKLYLAKVEVKNN